MKYFVLGLILILGTGATFQADAFEGDKRSADIDWETIDALIPLGGIRVEDNVVVTESGPRNLTREYLAD